MNQQRRPLSKLDLFKAAVTGSDSESARIAEALTAAGLSLAPHTNHTAWKPGMLSNIAGIEQAWRKHGPAIASAALRALGEALSGQVLRYAGSIFPGIVAICADEMEAGRAFDPESWPLFVEMIAEGEQVQWRNDIAQWRLTNPNLRYADASAAVFRQAWNELREALDEAA